MLAMNWLFSTTESTPRRACTMCSPRLYAFRRPLASRDGILTSISRRVTPHLLATSALGPRIHGSGRAERDAPTAQTARPQTGQRAQGRQKNRLCSVERRWRPLNEPLRTLRPRLLNAEGRRAAAGVAPHMASLRLAEGHKGRPSKWSRSQLWNHEQVTIVLQIP